jgi:hypothetical protein
MSYDIFSALFALCIGAAVAKFWIKYEIGANHLAVRLFTIELMRIPYSDITEIETGKIMMDRFRMINLGNRFGTMCRISKAHGIFRYVIVTPKEPKALLDAVFDFRSRSSPTSWGPTGTLPSFLPPSAPD